MNESPKDRSTTLSPVRILVLVLVIFFATEALVMVVLPLLLPPTTDNRIRAIVDAFLLTLVAAPVLWWVVIRPLRRFAVTEQAKAESIVSAAVDGIITIDEQGVVDSFNPAAEAIFGFRAEQLVGRDVSVLVPEEFLRQHREGLSRYRQTGRASVIGKTFEVPGRHRDGTIVPLELSISELRLGRRRLFTGIFRDLTASRARARQQQVMVEFGQQALVVTDLDELLAEAARCVAVTLGITHGAVWGLDRDEERLILRAGFGWPDEAVERVTLDARPNMAGAGLLADEPVVLNNVAAADSGDLAIQLQGHGILSGASVVIQGGDEPFGVLGAYSAGRRDFLTDDVHFLQDIAIEITLAIQRQRAELQQRERERLRAEQMAAVAQIATGVAHEIRNPLTSIKMLIQAAGETGTTGGLDRQDFAIIENEIRRMERSLNSFLDFARPPKLERQTFDLGELVQRTLALNEARAAQQGVKLETRPSGEPFEISADPDQIQQLLLNLILNALDAMPTGGTVEVRLAARSVGNVELQVLDDGPGISPDVAARLFQPFVTSKETGIGLGLVISRRIAEDHGGSLTVQSRPEGGTCFALRLPA